MKSVSIFLIAFIIVQSVASEKGETSSQDRQMQLLGINLEEVSDENQRIIRYCPDNTCEVFSVSNQKMTSAELSLLFSAYLVYWSDYWSLKKVRCELEMKDMSKLMTPKMVKSMVKKNGIHAYFIRFDEQDSISVPIDISKIISDIPKDCIQSH